MYNSGVIVGVEDGRVRIGVSTETHKNKCLASREAVEAAIITVLGTTLRVDVEVTSAKSKSKSATQAAPVAKKVEREDHVEEVIDVDDLVEAAPRAMETIAENRLLEAFPGATEEGA
jgi:hypothetical protein